MLGSQGHAKSPISAVPSQDTLPTDARQNAVIDGKTVSPPETAIKL